MDERLREALLTVIREVPDKYVDAPYAKTYAQAVFHNPHTGKEMEGKELRVQLLYVLNNLSQWGGQVARDVKGVLRIYSRKEVKRNAKPE